MPRDLPEPDDEATYPLLTNQPGVVAVDVVRRIRTAAVLFCCALALATVAGAYAATTIAAGASEDRVAALRDETRRIADDLRSDMNRRTAERRSNEALAGAILEQNRRTLCSLMRDLRDRGFANAEIDRLYPVYHCGTAKDPVVEPGWVPPPAWPALPPGPVPSSSTGN
jgi:hypothetical protein